MSETLTDLRNIDQRVELAGQLALWEQAQELSKELSQQQGEQ